MMGKISDSADDTLSGMKESSANRASVWEETQSTDFPNPLPVHSTLAMNINLAKVNLLVAYRAILTLGVEPRRLSTLLEYPDTQRAAKDVEGGHELVHRSCNESCAIQ
jgi:hypothetical protein